MLSEQQNFSHGPAQNMRHCEQHGQCFDPFPSASFLKHQPDDQKSCGEMNKPFPVTLPESAKWHKDLTAHSHGKAYMIQMLANGKKHEPFPTVCFSHCCGRFCPWRIWITCYHGYHPQPTGKLTKQLDKVLQLWSEDDQFHLEFRYRYQKLRQLPFHCNDKPRPYINRRLN